MAVQQEARGWNVDFVICLDATKSMAPIINEVKANAISLYRKFVDAMEESGKNVDQLRVKVIAFRDYGYDTEPMTQSEFFTLPAQNEEFRHFVDTIEAKGGKEAVSFNNNEPSNALEAIALALKSDWTTGGLWRRHVVLVFSDAPALPLGERADSPSYPSGLPKNLAELGAWWEGIDRTLDSTYQRKAGRLMAFIPNAEPWVDIQTWNNYWPVFSTAGTGLEQETRGWNVDFVICLDATKSMAPIINEVKANAMSFYQICYDEMTEVGISVDQLRVKVIAFRDYGYDTEPMVESEFFTLPAQNEQLKNFMDTIEAKGGKEAVSFNNNEPSNALEAIALALKSDWTTGGSRRRHVVLVFSDAPALPLGERADSPSYPSGLPKNLAELRAWRADTDRILGSTYQWRAGRLIAFVPNAEPWADLQACTFYWPAFSTVGTGLEDVDIQTATSIIWDDW